MVQQVRNFTHGQLSIVDGAGRTLLIPLDEGNLTFEETEEAKTIMSRGKTKQFAKGVEEPIPVSFSLHFTEYFSKDRNGVLTDDVSVRDFLKGDYSGAQSITNCAPHQTRLEFFLESPCATGSGDKDELIFFDPFHTDKVAFSEEEESNKLTVTGKGLRAIPNNNVPTRNPV